MAKTTGARAVRVEIGRAMSEIKARMVKLPDGDQQRFLEGVEEELETLIGDLYDDPDDDDDDDDDDDRDDDDDDDDDDDPENILDYDEDPEY